MDTNFIEAANALAKIIEQPNSKKGYIDLKKYYESIKREDYTKAISKLIEIKFNVDNTNNN